MRQIRTTGGPPSAPNADFDHPIEMLAACHERIEARCELLHRLLEHVSAKGCDVETRQAAASVLRYFDTAGEHHHEDEEMDLFPLLLAADADAAPLVHRLKREHGEMRASWQELRVPLAAMAAGESVPLDEKQVTGFTALYRAHIAREDSELLPLAARALDAATLARIGESMAKRRGVAR